MYTGCLAVWKVRENNWSGKVREKIEKVREKNLYVVNVVYSVKDDDNYVIFAMRN